MHNFIKILLTNKIKWIAKLITIIGFSSEAESASSLASSFDGVLNSADVKTLAQTQLIDDIGDKLAFGVSESNEPRLSEPGIDIIDLGDWFS
jgi:hypothetical protein